MMLTVLSGSMSKLKRFPTVTHHRVQTEGLEHRPARMQTTLNCSCNMFSGTPRQGDCGLAK